MRHPIRTSADMRDPNLVSAPSAKTLGSVHMSNIRTLTIAAVAAFALATPALAQDEMMMQNNGAMMISPTGQMMMTESMDKSMIKMAMKSAAEVEDGTIFFMSGGKLYMVKDMKMENGKMMSEGMMMEQ